MYPEVVMLINDSDEQMDMLYGGVFVLPFAVVLANAVVLPVTNAFVLSVAVMLSLSVLLPVTVVLPNVVINVDFTANNKIF